MKGLGIWFCASYVAEVIKVMRMERIVTVRKSRPEGIHNSGQGCLLLEARKAGFEIPQKRDARRVPSA